MKYIKLVLMIFGFCFIFSCTSTNKNAHSTVINRFPIYVRSGRVKIEITAFYSNEKYEEKSTLDKIFTYIVNYDRDNYSLEKKMSYTCNAGESCKPSSYDFDCFYVKMTAEGGTDAQVEFSGRVLTIKPTALNAIMLTFYD